MMNLFYKISIQMNKYISKQQKYASAGKQQRYKMEENIYYEEEYLENPKNLQKYHDRNRNNRNGEEVLEKEDNDNNNDEEDQMYDPKQLIKAKEDNFRIVQNSKNIKEQNNNNIHINEGEGEGEDIEEDKENMDTQGQEHEQEEIIQNSNIKNINSEENLYQREEESPLDQDEIISSGTKSVKNIQKEINEKYYDNQGNYLGEKKLQRRSKFQ